jgi:osmotically inducible lipoprotein OsmB
MKKFAIVFVLVMSLAFLGCAGMTDTQQRTLSGAAIGAAAGTAIGAMSGSAGWGAAIGAAAGAGGGYIYDKHEKSKEAAYQQGYEEGKKNQ